MKNRIMFLILVTICFISGCSNQDTLRMSEEELTEVVVIQNTTTATETTDEAVISEKALYDMGVEGEGSSGSYTFEEDSNYDVKNLIRSYYDCLTNGEYEAAAYYTNDSSRLDRELFMEKSEYLFEVKSLDCYIMDGMIDGSYIVVARCGFKTTICADVVTVLEAFYICTNESGTLYICGSPVGDEVASYNSIMLSDPLITEVVSEVASENKAAMDKNDELSKISGIIISAGISKFLYEMPLAKN